MKILWLTEDFPGITKFLHGESIHDEGMPAQYNPLIYFANNGCKIDIVTQGRKRIIKKRIHKNITSTVFKKTKINKLTRFGWYDVRLNVFINFLKSIYVAKSMLNSNKYDLIYSHWEYQSAVGGLLSYFFSIPNVTRLYGSNLYGRTGGQLTFKNKIIHFNRYLPFITKKELLILTQDGTRGDDAYNQMRMDKRKIIVPLNGVDFSRKCENYDNKYELLRNKYVISYIGTVGGWKRTDLFIKTLGKIKKIIPNICYCIIGDGPLLNILKERVKSAGLHDSVLFTGRVSQDERKYLLKLSKIYVSMYKYTNLTNTFLEAIVQGIPSLVILNGKTKLVAKDGVNCLYVDEMKPEQSLINKIEYLYKNPHQRLLLGKNARIYSKKNLLSWDDRCRNDLKLIKKVCENYHSNI